MPKKKKERGGPLILWILGGLGLGALAFEIFDKPAYDKKLHKLRVLKDRQDLIADILKELAPIQRKLSESTELELEKGCIELGAWASRWLQDNKASLNQSYAKLASLNQAPVPIEEGSEYEKELADLEYNRMLLGEGVSSMLSVLANIIQRCQALENVRGIQGAQALEMLYQEIEPLRTMLQLQ